MTERSTETATAGAALKSGVEAAKRKWRGSITTRIMVATGLITAIIITSTFVYMSALVGNDLFENKRDEVLADAAGATQAAQRILDASDAGERASLTNLMAAVQTSIRDTSASPQILVRRDANQLVNDEAPLDFTTDAALASIITPELATQVGIGNASQYWQSVSLSDSQGQSQPGIVVGSSLVFPSGAGRYELFLGYSLAESESTLQFVQRTLLFTAVVLMLLMGVLVWSVIRFVFRPIRVAAEASSKLAAGDEQVRIPDLGDEHFNQLASSFNEMADTLQTRYQKLSELSQMQQRFVADVSHELRTPLTTIRLASDVLYADRSDLKAPAERSAELLHAQVLRFEALLESLLEISRYDAGDVELHFEVTDLDDLVHDEVKSLQALSESPLKFKPASTDTTVEVDALRIRRIVSNLLSNAIEHGEGKPIEIAVTSTTTEVICSVRDHGIGIDPQHLSHVFERFWRADPARARTLGGSGLGLAIALEDAEAHGGTIEVTSKPGDGTEFVLKIPRSSGSVAGGSDR